MACMGPEAVVAMQMAPMSFSTRATVLTAAAERGGGVGVVSCADSAGQWM